MSSQLAKGRKLLGPLLAHLSSIYTPGQLDSLLHAFSQPRKSSFRLTTLKVPSASLPSTVATIQTHLRTLRYTHPPPRTVKCSWHKHAYQISNTSVDVQHFLTHPLYTSGQMHFQSLSSMIPPVILSPQPGERVLDMCAAPGGKSTQLVEAVGKSGRVVVNEVDRERMWRLVKTVERLVPEEVRRRVVEYRLGDGRKLEMGAGEGGEFEQGGKRGLGCWAASAAQGSQEADVSGDGGSATGTQPQRRYNKSRVVGMPFDAVLVDAPCSGEGTIDVTNPVSYRHWSPQYVAKQSKLQRQLLLNAYTLLKPGGTLVYSTCTLSPQENEEVVQELLDKYRDNVEVMELDPPFGGEDGLGLGNFSRGLRRHLGKEFRRDMENALRVFPNEDYEGFFVAKLRKTEV
ncbi:hypothetical protein HK104_005722 [Borealophlyctis nickersoniae]|nr:hypothetical protein HK104_005722 [Borealophlyctis nickersoniae]